MKIRFTIFLAMLVALSMLLAACGPAEEAEETPGVTEPLGTEPLGTEPLATEPLATEPPATEPPATEPPETEPAATEPVTETEVVPPTGAINPGLISNWMDLAVISSETNEEIGQAQDVILDFEQDQVSYLVVESGGLLGVGSKLVPIPFDRVELRVAAAAGEAEATPEATPEAAAAEEPTFVVEVTEEELENAPEFDPGLLPALGEPAADWDGEIQSFWATGVTAEETPAATEAVTEEPTATEAVTEAPGVTPGAELQGVVLESDLLGMTLQSSDGEGIGTVEDVAVDIEDGTIQYIIISTDVAEISGQWMPVPTEGFSVNAEEEVLVLNVEQDVLVSAPNFAPDDFPDTTEEGWDADVQTFWEGELGAETGG